MARITCGCGAEINGSPYNVNKHAGTGRHKDWLVSVGGPETPKAPEEQTSPEDSPPADQVTAEEQVARPSPELGQGIRCPECNEGPFRTFSEVTEHITNNVSGSHDRIREAEAQVTQAGLQEAANARAEGLPEDLAEIVRNISETPQVRAKMLRHAFAAPHRRWPNPTHRGTVEDFIKEYKIEAAPDSERIQRKRYLESIGQLGVPMNTGTAVRSV